MDKETCMIVEGNCAMEHLDEMGEDAEILKNKIEALNYAKKIVEKS